MDQLISTGKDSVLDDSMLDMVAKLDHTKLRRLKLVEKLQTTMAMVIRVMVRLTLGSLTHGLGASIATRFAQ